MNDRVGYSLLELVMATALVAGTMAPSLALMRDAMELSETTDQRQLLANYSVSLLEKQLGVVASDWIEQTLTGDLAAEGFADLRYIVVASDNAVDGGMPDQLMSVTSTTYWDANQDDTLNSGELTSVFRTKISKLISYTTKAAN